MHLQLCPHRCRRLSAQVPLTNQSRVGGRSAVAGFRYLNSSWFLSLLVQPKMAVASLEAKLKFVVVTLPFSTTEMAAASLEAKLDTDNPS